MKLTSKSEYALLALVYLARKPADEKISVKEIGLAQDIPAQFLQHILLDLKNSGVVTSSKGKGGGFKLAKDPKQIILADIVRLFEGPLAPTDSTSTYFYQPSPVEKEKKLLSLFKEVRDLVAERMERETLADVI